MPTEEQMKDQAQQQQGQQQGQDGQKQGQEGQPSPGIKDKDAETSNTYGNTRDSGETPK